MSDQPARSPGSSGRGQPRSLSPCCSRTAYPTTSRATDAYGNRLPLGPTDAGRAGREAYRAGRNAAEDAHSEGPCDRAAIECRQYECVNVG